MHSKGAGQERCEVLKRCRRYTRTGMEKEHVLETVTGILQRAGWNHSRLPGGCFDVMSKGEQHVALLKVHANVDSVTRPDSEEIKQAAQYLSASPLIVGERNSRGELEKQVIYERYGIPTVKPETLEAYLDMQEKLYVMNRKGGYYVSIDAEKFEEKRKEEGYSVNGLAKEIGVTARTVTKYRRNGVATVETAKRITSVLGDVVQEVNIFEQDLQQEERQQIDRRGELAQRFIKIGMDAAGFQRAPFDVAAKDEEDRFVAKKAQREEVVMINLLRAIQDLSESNPFLITRRNKDYSDIGSISERRLRRIKDKDEFKAEIL